jgi:nucleoside-diphosphate-sugar epimerase
MAPSRAGAAVLGADGAGPGLGPERATPRCARIFRMTAGSCSVAIRRSRPPQCGHARTSTANARCLEGTRLLNRLRSPDQLVLFASTGSNYDAVVGSVCTEDTPLNPLSEYGVTKTSAERHLLEAGNVICYRFATAFGVSNRMRSDLLVDDFVYQAKINKDLIIYERTFKRTFIHVRDMARAFAFGLDNWLAMRDGVYNVGSEEMNYNKEEVALLIKKKIDYYLHFAEIGRDEDQRNYEVSYAKIGGKGFKAEVDMETGIEELIKAADLLVLHNEFSNV